VLPGAKDDEVWHYFASVVFSSEAMVRNGIRALEPDRPQATAALERRRPIARVPLCVKSSGTKLFVAAGPVRASIRSAVRLPLGGLIRSTLGCRGTSLR
jgi:hypothetical protein